MQATVETLARGSLAMFASYRHGEGSPHHDPTEERFDRATVIFTTHGSWDIHSPVGTTKVDRSIVVLGDEGRSYRASHEDRFPTDRTQFLELGGSPAGAPTGGSMGELREIHPSLGASSA